MNVAHVGGHPFIPIANGAANGLPNGNGASRIFESALRAIASVGAAFLDRLSEIASHTLSITTLRYAFYGLRVPFIYLEYFVHDAMNDSAIALLGNVLYLFAELGNFAQWLNHLSLIDLGGLSSALGKFEILGSLGVSPIDAGLGLISGLASVFYAVDYIMKLSSGKLSDNEVIAVCFGLSASIVHIIAIIIFFASGGTLFLLSVGLTLASVALYVTYWALKESPVNV